MVTMQQIRAILDSEEPDYALAAKLGSGALTHIETLIKGVDPKLASKAAYLAGLIQDSYSTAVLKIAAQSKYPEVRIAVAAGARHLDSQATSEVLLCLIEDQDSGVRKMALKSAPLDATPALRKRIENLATKDSENFVRSQATEVVIAIQKSSIPLFDY